MVIDHMNEKKESAKVCLTPKKVPLQFCNHMIYTQNSDQLKKKYAKRIFQGP